MVLINKAINEVTVKLVYYGPGLCGKTTNLEKIYSNPKLDKKGKMISMATETDRTLFFDFMPMELGTIGGQKVRVQLYTVPGKVFYDATRKLGRRGADGVVFVADSQPSMKESNIASLENLKTNLRLFHQAYGRVRRALGRLGVQVVCAANDEPVPLILDRLERLRTMRRKS